MAEINGIKVPFIPLEQTATLNNRYEPDTNFKSFFKEELNKLKFSNHAVKRLETRNIHLNDHELNKIQNAVNAAEAKGSRDSLVMMDKTAFIVNIPNKTVVTALSVEESNSVFTNIDSVVFA